MSAETVDLIERLLAELVAARSVSSYDPTLEDPPEPVLARLREQLEGLGAHCVIHADISARGRPVLVADLGGDAHHGAVLLGHVDTVPAVEPDHWVSDPWTLQRREGRWIGLGVSDMKGFFACAVATLARVRQRLRRPVRLIATTDEESGMQGMRGVVAQGLIPDAPVVIGEPTSGVRAGGCRGLLAFRLIVRGVEGHSSRPPLRGRAVDALAALLRRAREFEDAWRKSPRPEGSMTMNFGVIQGGDAFNRLIARVTLDGELRLPPGTGLDQAERVLAGLADAAVATGCDCRIELLERFAPCSSPDASELPVMPYVCEASLLPANHRFRIWGPGDLDQAHRIDESLDIEAAARYCDDLEAWLMECCG